MSRTDSLVEGNSVRGGGAGIVIVLAGSPTLIGNTVEGMSVRGIAIDSGTSPTLSDNTVCGSQTNLWVAENAEPLIDESNEICPDASAEASE